MHLSDEAIKSIGEDKLERRQFVEHLVKKISLWKNPDCLVVSLSGKWGSGKSSILYFVKEEINKKKLSNDLIIIEFNPWYFSGEGNLTYHFYNELAKEIKIKGNTDSDKKIAQTLILYASIFDAFLFVPSKLVKYFGIMLGFGIFATTLLSHYHFYLYIISLVIIGISFSKGLCEKIGRIFEEKAKLGEKSLLSIKEDLKAQLSQRKNKLLILIDDIDRLNDSEIKQIFQLVKINTDLPNMIYLMSFDREIVEKNLTIPDQILGKEYLKKIVQVDFDIPAVKKSKIQEILLNELNSILSKLPPHDEYFDEKYWENVISTGFLDLFENLRDVKRFANSLEFNISLMHQNDSIEINPIDFIVIEFIRVWYPKLYESIEINKFLLTKIPQAFNNSDFEREKKAIDDLLLVVDDHNREIIKKLLFEIFPQCKMSYNNTNWYPPKKEWHRQLRICSEDYFDSYFTLIPGGSEDELTQYDFDSTLNHLENMIKLESDVKKYIKTGKINQFLKKLQYYTDDINKIPSSSVKNLTMILFNIYGKIPSQAENSNMIQYFNRDLFVLTPEQNIIRTVSQLIEREQNENERYNLLLESINSVEYAICPVIFLSLKDDVEKEQIFSSEHLEELKKSSIKKLEQSINAENLLDIYNVSLIIDCWKRWSNDSTRLDEILLQVVESDERLITFMELFINYIYSSEGTRIKETEPFFYVYLGSFVDIESIKSRLEDMKESKKQIYIDKKEIVDLFLDKYTQNVSKSKALKIE